MKNLRNEVLLCFAIGLIACGLLVGSPAALKAQTLPSSAEWGAASSAKGDVYLRIEPVGFDDFDDAPCARFPKENVFDSLEKAFQMPEKVKCLAPTFEGDDLNMKRLPSRLGTLVNLQVFSFGCLEQLETLPVEIGNLSKLEELIIDNGNGCEMRISLPGSIGKLENLRVLRLYGAFGARNLPGSIANLRKLEILDLGRNGLKAVPPQIAALSGLKTLRLEYNDLRAVPAFVGNFKNLKELSLDSNNKISNLPAALAKFKGLTVSMGNNALKLRDQKNLRSRFPQIVFSFENEYEDERANEETPKPKSRTKGKQ